MAATAAAADPPELPHIVIFPFPSKGHTIPLVHFAHLLHRRRLAAVTFLTTPLHAPFLRASLAATPATVVELPFPHGGDRLPSMSLFFPFVASLALLQPHFETAVRSLRPPPAFLVSDGFFSWSLASARRLGIPRLVFTGMGVFANAMTTSAAINNPILRGTENITLSLPEFPNVKVTTDDLNFPVDDGESNFTEMVKTMSESDGYIINSFHEMDAVYADYWKANACSNSWLVGPLCLGEPDDGKQLDPVISSWLDQKLAADRPVLYVAFGSQAEISPEQMKEIAAGLEDSGVDFLRVTKPVHDGDNDVAESGGRGLVVKTWVEQRAILNHESVKGFMSHCGWNSVLESMCAGVPMVAWPMLAEQWLNTKYVVEVHKVGIQVLGSERKGNVVARDTVAAAARRVLGGEGAEGMRERAADWAAVARKSMEEGGCSWRSLENVVEQVTARGVHAVNSAPRG